MKNKIIVTVLVVVAGLAVIAYALTAGKSVSANIHSQTDVQKTDAETPL